MSRHRRLSPPSASIALLALLAAQCAEPMSTEDSTTEEAVATYYPVADATVDASRPGANSGSTDSLLVDRSPAVLESYIRFANLPTLAIDRAVLRLYVTDGSTDGPALYTSGTAWVESTITWQNRPARSSTAIGDKGAVSAGSWIEFDVTAQVRGRSAVGFVLAGDAADGTDFSSRTGANRPRLVITPSETMLDGGTRDASASDVTDGSTPDVTDGSAPDVTDSGTVVTGCGDQVCSATESCSTCPADCNTCAPGSASIWLPRTHAPRFTTAGGTFTAEIAGPSSLGATAFRAALRNDLRSFPATVTRATFGTIHHGLTPGWTLEIRVPGEISPELFDLSVTHPNGGGNTSERSVQVLRDPEESFYILHISDQHVRAIAAAQPNGAPAEGGGSQEAMRWAANVFNVVNPRFVLVTGDNNQIYNHATSWPGVDVAIQRLNMWKEGLRSWRVPSVVTNGNHDVGYRDYIQSAEWRAIWEREIGERVYSTRIGSFYILTNELTYQDYLGWARSDFLGSFEDPSVKYRLLAIHYPSDWTDVSDATHRPDLLLAGHSHRTSVYATSPYPQLTVGTAQNYYPAAYFSFDRTSTGWRQPPQVANHGDGRNAFPLFGDNGAPKVTLAFDRANDGSQSSNTARIVNSLPLNFADGRVRFIVPRGSYTVTGGTITASYDHANNTRTAVLVRVNIPAGGAATVSIAPR